MIMTFIWRFKSYIILKITNILIYSIKLNCRNNKQIKRKKIPMDAT